MLGWCARYGTYRSTTRNAAASAISFFVLFTLLKDGQLMRSLKLLALGFLFIAGTAFPVSAQAPATPPAEQTPTQQPPVVPPPAPQRQAQPAISDDDGR